ncbi:hypothetical protein K9M74_05095 [Candidatus Woesearchaeota archaeon]|nr:hypothetical protein [Candidatus Woesearchaeota archaeon]
MKRKLIRLAEKTLVVSVPATWAKQQGLDKGDELDCDISDTKIVLTPPRKTPVLQTIQIDISHVSERVLRWNISSLHKQGYDEIIVTSFNDSQYEIIEDMVKNLFIGFIVKDKSNLRIVIGQVAVVDASEFDATLRRAFRQLISVFEETQESFLNANISLLKKQIENEYQNNKLTNFCERLLNKSLTQKEKGHFWYVIAWNLEKIVDNFKYLAVAIDTIVPSDAVNRLFIKLQKYAQDYYEFFYEFSFERLTQLSVLKKELELECLTLLASASKQERLVGHYMHMVVLQLADFSASTIALRFNGIEV